jgi:hypothetical protein
MTNKTPIRVAVYGKGLPKVNFALTGEPPYYHFDFVGRDFHIFKDKENVFVCDFNSTVYKRSLEATLDDIKQCIDITKRESQSGTIIIDRMTDLIRLIDYKDKERSQVFLPRTNLIIKETITRLMETNLDIIMLFGEKEIWVKDKPSGYYDPDWIEDIKHMIHFKIHALPNEYRQFDKMVYAYRIMDNPTISYLKSIRG